MLAVVLYIEKDLSIKCGKNIGRGIMTRLLTAPYSRDAWEFVLLRHNVSCITLSRVIITHTFQDTIYMAEENSEQDMGLTERDQRFIYYGYRFETVSTLSVPPTQVTREALDKRIHDDSNTNIEFGSVIKSRFGKIQVVLGGEVDCLYKGTCLLCVSLTIPGF